jgi:FtsP/CotA-like multicopper oxidase with cupredoxin domain
MNRRQFLTASAASVAAFGCDLPGAVRVATAAEEAPRRLAMPPLLDTRASGRLELIAQQGLSNFLGGEPTLTSGYNQGYLGPTIRVGSGPLAVRIGNRLPETVTVHWHGLLVPGEHDGGPHSPVEPGQFWTPQMEIKQQPATLWYHSHVHGRTAQHVYSGLAGVLQVTDGRDDQRGLPSEYGVDDLQLIVQDRRFDEAGRMVYNPTTTDILNGFTGNRILVNGQANAVAVVPRAIVRLRLLNASNSRFYTFNFDDRRPLHLIATDGGFLPSPVALSFLRMAPGERAEVLVDFSAGGTATMMSNRQLTMRILDFAVDDRLPGRIKRLPDDLGAVPFDLPETAEKTRRFGLNVGGSSTDATVGAVVNAGLLGQSGEAGQGGHAHAHGGSDGQTIGDFGINGRPHDMNRIDEEVKLGAVERWVIGGGGVIEHPFHVHGVQFKVISEGGGARPRPESSGWKDTIVISGETAVMVRFTHAATREKPFMYHCHILEHEDAGMMGQFTVS